MTKILRILIVEACPVQRDIIEKLLRCLGYFRIATTPCIEEAWALNQYKSLSFDLLVINVRLLCHSHALAFTGSGEGAVNHLLIYGLHDRSGDAVMEVNAVSVIELMPGLPEYWRVADFMKRVEKCLKKSATR